jgi:thiol-disulfide isomerase/thioredoxin
MSQSYLRNLILFSLCLAMALLPHCSTRGKESSAAPGFSLKTLEDQEIALTSLKGKVVLLDFWATWCGPCREAIPHLASLQKKYQEKGLIVIGMNVDKGERDVVRRFVKSMEIPYPILLTPEEVVRSYGVSALPTSVLIDKEGNIREKITGFNSSIAKKLSERVGELTSEK